MTNRIITKTILFLFVFTSIIAIAQKPEIDPSEIPSNISPQQLSEIKKQLSKTQTDNEEKEDPIEKTEPKIDDEKEIDEEIDEEIEKEKIDDEKEIDEEIEKEEEEKPTLRRFGFDYFEIAKQRILKIESDLIGKGLPKSKIRDAIGGFVGPTEIGKINAIIPEKRILSSGDHLILFFWSNQTPIEQLPIVVDPQGNVVLPEIGKIVARGMTLMQFETAAREVMSRNQFTDLKVIATFEELNTIQIFVTGEAFRPGSYATSSVTTVFNALYLSGGPNENGALRDIRLIRNGETTKIDFYKYLMSGDASHDITLLPGDIIYIASVGRLITIEGEVKRPGIYEMITDENFADLIRMAGGLRPSGFGKRIQIETVDPNLKRILREIDLTENPSAQPEIYDGDIVRVLPILDEVLNIVQLDGAVKRADTYELIDGMRISDLIRKAEGLEGEAHLPRADLFRLNADEKTTTLIPINLELALRQDDQHDLLLKERDRLVVYSQFDIKWTAEREVSVQGAIVNSDTFERLDGMKIADLVMQAGGVLPEAHLDRATLFRLNDRLEIAFAIPIALESALKKNAEHDLILKDGDSLLIHRFDEVRWIPDREVTATGNVQNPAIYPRVDEMRISDLIFQSGGPLPDTDQTALLLRRNRFWEVAISFEIDLEKAIAKNPEADLELQDGDNLLIFKREENKWISPREVTISGAVQSPGVYERVDEMRISDLLFRGGGVLPNTSLKRANIHRYLPDQETLEVMPISIEKVIAGDAEHDLLLNDRDTLVVLTIREAEYHPDRAVTIYGAVQNPDTYIRMENMRVSDLIFAAGDVLPSAHTKIQIARANGVEKTEIKTVEYDLVQQHDAEHDLLLQDYDVVTIPQQKEYREKPLMIEISGEVKYPGRYAIQETDRLSDLIKRSGNLTKLAFPQGSVFTRLKTNLIDETQEQALRKTLDDLEAEKQYEYIRELAKSQLSDRESESGETTLETAAETITQISANPLAAPTAAISEISGLATDETEKEKSETSAKKKPSTIFIVPDQTENGSDLDADLSEKTPAVAASVGGFAVNLVTPARKIEDQIPGNRIHIDLPSILASPKSEIDPILQDGDTIYIPQIRPIVIVTGAVLHPTALVFQPDLDIDNYIEMTGGFARDADKEGVYVLKANGLAYRKKKVEKIESGDVIVVPTKVMVDKVTDRWGQVVSLIRVAIITASTIFLLDRLAK